ncbi:MAG: endonuclease III [Coprococcus sp.]|nr:endonuclease III [Coprococcus sp.]
MEKIQDKPKKRISKKEKERIAEIVRILNETYTTEYKCYLNHENAWQLLIATMLSAQCTDARVNMVTKDLFVKYPTLQAFADADVKELEKDIYSTGFYKNKAKNIIGCAQKLISDYGGEVPNDIDALTQLDGVGRKTANVIRGNIFHEPSIVVDTHVKRISNLLGLTKEEDPVKIEYDLMDKLPKEQWILYNIQIITHGRNVCIARRPKCDECTLASVCPSSKIPVCPSSKKDIE